MIRAIKRFLKPYFKKVSPFLMAYPGLGLLRILYFTCRIEIKGVDRFADCASKQPCILMLWHNRLVMAPYILSTYVPQYIYTALISNSQDGELLAAVTETYPQGRSIRVSQNAKYNALREVIKQLKKGQEIILITPDGPRGPKYRVKSGIVLAAMNSEARVVPLTWSSSRFWQLKTWDKLIVPKPFSKIVVTFGDPLHCEGDMLSHNTLKLQEALNGLTSQVCSKVQPDESFWPK